MQEYYWLYILTNKSNNVFYIGITNNLLRRIWEHKNKLMPGFTEKYNVNKLVYFIDLKTVSIYEAMNREQRIKRWNKEWKRALINEFNPGWDDLYPNILSMK